MSVPTLRYLSLGAGVQSSTLYLMACRGEFGPDAPTLAVFADTHAEPAAVYDWLAFLEREGGATIPIVRASTGNLWDDALTTIVPRKVGAKKPWYRKATLPLYTASPSGTAGMLPRRCTRTYKIEAVWGAVRRHLGVAKGRRLPTGTRVEAWMGISTDEASRMKDAAEPWVRNVYPLVDRGMSRTDCLAWFARAGLPTPPKSACLFCPYTSNARWAELQRERPEDFARVVAFERAYNATNAPTDHPAYLHAARVPLDRVDFERELVLHDQLNLFENECEGMCGV